ncbi:tripartite tricarboxylate transporter TctB family protein [Peribacillus cavernae]|uniref:Tripartite tricarboxylate transporter TctB family protein n=1 Tax=Peribacillus cavernae TaxID=1674310 RepID=A0A433HWW5_9BACI|nr:tripartite tricarboxylate transporter TctB family protein [Peribacillus cavernae]MDQ0221140.1 sterol desaturase/sphingolipid hydroxylase (fatty acid hydroxylase superfamily) [Peribacillus cavernae]RUQ32820.1 tripartite tricarboxylate transporter TctB family protein [Peribacillus cavernae]
MNNLGLWIGLIMLLFAGTIFGISLSYDLYSDLGPGPGLFPAWLSGFLIILSLFYIWESIKKEVILLQKILPKGKGKKKVLTLLGSIVLFILIAPYIGFTMAAIVMLFMILIAEFKWYWGVGISTAISILLFLVFDSFLHVPLPVNAFGF